MKNQVAVSIIIPTYNYAEFLPRAIKSALSQTLKDCEVIVVDDGSTDNTSEVVSEFKDTIQYHYQENKGLSAARNTGIKLAKGKFLQFLDADDTIAPEKLERQFLIHEADDTIGVSYSDYLVVDNAGQVIEEANARLRLEGFNGTKDFLEILLEECFIVPHCPLIRSDIFKKEAGFDETPDIAEDWEMWLRLAIRGFKFKMVPEVLAYYYKHDRSMTINHQLLHQRRLLLLEKFSREEFQHLLGDKEYKRFYSYQNLMLGQNLYNFGDWSEARRFLIKALITDWKVSNGFKTLLLTAKSIMHQTLSRK